MLVLHVPEQSTKPPVRSTILKLPQKLDFVGFALFAPACILFLIAISWGGTNYPWNSATVIGLLCGCVGILDLFIAWSIYRGDEALIPLSLLRQRTLFYGCWISGLQGGATLMMGYYLPFWFQSTNQRSESNEQWADDATNNDKSNPGCSHIWSSWYARVFSFGSLLHLLISKSSKVALYASLGYIRQSDHCNWVGAHDHVHSDNDHGPMDWLSNTGRVRTRCSSKYGQSSKKSI